MVDQRQSNYWIIAGYIIYFYSRENIGITMNFTLTFSIWRLVCSVITGHQDSRQSSNMKHWTRLTVLHNYLEPFQIILLVLKKESEHLQTKWLVSWIWTSLSLPLIFLHLQPSDKSSYAINQGCKDWDHLYGHGWSSDFTFQSAHL